MIWLTWRQFRTQATVAVAALAALAIYLVILGNQMRHAYTADIIGCLPEACTAARRDFEDAYGAPVALIGALLLGVPALIGVFWGAPLITRELEEKTDRMVWNQSITRTRWLAVKLTLLALASMAVTGLYSLLLTWSASRYDQLIGGRFAALTFASRNLVPIGYAVFAFLLGTTIGLLVRRTLPAMAVTLAVFAVVQVVLPIAVRQHLMSPVTTTVQLDQTAMERSDFMGVGPDGARIDGYTAPGAWSLTTTSKLYSADGTPYTAAQSEKCHGTNQQEDMACTVAQNIHFSYTYHPADRYWRFQWIELILFGGLSLILAGFCLLRIRRYSS
ncbi:ABC-type transport system involved in multi-copper enzyme maturation permease subunit [Hamadaea flava]|uniref:ABC transporter permease subunit n=1 Tax=Hamadaea flava TaxID=1742688 RepID=A0ABV8LN14_9ACTN|nr:ABC transporter permease subunit [Hamadaea flava]MCP2322992.1 ABC-type transport system involved in multi-copper enzyme maturation permease subunit [Hamadaea flava]